MAISVERHVLIVDDDRLLASLISELLERHGFHCWLAHDVSEAKKILRTTEIDVALVDVHLGDGPSGVQLAVAMKKNYSAVGLVFLTKTPDVFSLGFDAKGLPESFAVVGKENIGRGEDLLDAIQSVVSTTREPVRHSRPESAKLQALTTHQRDILKEVAAGYTNRAIAERHQVTERSVERSVQAIFQRLGINPKGEKNPRIEATRYYVEAFGFPPRSP